MTDWASSVMTVAAKDPALASILVHQHDCLESAKRDISATRSDVNAIKDDLRTILFATVTTLLTVVGIIVWYVITHPRGYA